MYAMDSWLEQLEEEVGPYVKPLLDIVYLALDSESARPQVRRGVPIGDKPQNHNTHARLWSLA